jgi:segregation and condensation protein B
VNQELRPILEALLFASPDPVSVEQLQAVLGETAPQEIREGLVALRGEYEQRGAGLMILEVAGGFRMATRSDLHSWVNRLAKTRPTRLSRPALETLAIIAYRQPITKPEVEAIRGVLVDGVLKTLMERGLIRILGRKREVGRPLLYGTTRTFLEYFGFQDITELPSPQEIEALLSTRQEQHRDGGSGGESA